MGAAPDLVLKYSHHIIEHLGLKLYQNRPTNVIAELVSNGWDANAAHVWIDLRTAVADGNSRFIAVIDDGQGMTAEEIAGSYLVIGKPKERPKAGSSQRYPMGRKGIGKLAPFGIASTVELLTAANTAGGLKFNWIRIELVGILTMGRDAGPTAEVSYPPRVVLRDGAVDDVRQLPDSTGQVNSFLDRTRGGTGTLILMSDLSLLKQIDAASLRQSMGRRFTVTLARSDFSVEVGGKVVEDEDALPEFEFRLPQAGFIEEKVGARRVKYWVGFVKTAAWPSDEAGVGVYAHGKIAQDRPFTFGVKGKEIFTRYMYGVVEADFIDELQDDLISTDRRSINWDHPNAAPLYDWGQRKVRQWIEEYRLSRRRTEAATLRKVIDDQISAGLLPKVGEDEKRMISELLSEVTPGLEKDETQYSRVTAAVMKAYLHQPTRELLKKLWSSYGEGGADPRPFLDMTEKLAAAAVPEALSLAVTFAQRGYALSVLWDMQHRGTEPELQKLITKFPWILQPDMELLTANQWLKTTVEAAHAAGLSPSRFTAGQVEVDETFRPDFVFFSDVEYQRIVIVEIKSPREDLNFRNREQLSAYMVYVEQQYPGAQRKGYLVGTNGQNMQRGRDDIEIMSWTDVFVNSRRGHIDMLAAMLATAEPAADDNRMKQILEFGGEQVWEILTRVSANDEKLADLLSHRPLIK